MKSLGNQSAIGTKTSGLDPARTCAVQESNLQPKEFRRIREWRDRPVCSCVIRGLPRHDTRTCRESPTPDGNRTAIPSPVRSFRVPPEIKKDQEQKLLGWTEKSKASPSNQRQTPKTRIQPTTRGMAS